MKWLLLSCFLLWARHGEGGAILKCIPGDDECSQSSEEIQQQEIDIRRPSGAGADAPAECLAGSEWDSNCHSCHCSDNGEAICTKHDQCDSLIEEPVRCKPNTTFERECNTCVCLESGLGLCTMETCERMLVEESSLRVPSMAAMPLGVECAPGSTWQSQCNDCVCSPEGWRHCTERTCATPESESLVRCAPNTVWRNDCNRCWCNNGLPMCTKMGCAAIPSDMHFDSEKEIPESQDILEPNAEVPDLNNNFPYDTKVELLPNKSDENKTPNLVEENLNEAILKDLDDYDHNDIDKTKDSAEELETELTANSDSEVDKNVELFEASNDNQESKVRDIEVFETPYYNRQHMHRVQKRSACKPNEDFKTECNVCKCSASGESYSCTQNECMDSDKEAVDKEVEVFMESEGVDHIERHSVCKPSAVFYSNCNPCRCNADGTDFSCTNKPCPLPEDVEVFHELNALKSSKNSTKKVCVENRMFIMNCNTCWCNEDGTSYFCTRKACVKEPTDPVVEDGATENETQSRKIRATPQEAAKACTPGQEFRLDCNQCLCDNTGQDFSCTRIDCNALNNNNNGARRKRDAHASQKVSADCVPGSVFDQGCNVCRCTDDGGHATCTLKRCAQNKENSTLTATESSFRCNPGEQFKQSCNDCSCSADGKSVYCTLMVCDEDLTP